MGAILPAMSHDLDYRNLDVWKRAHAAVLAIYGATRAFPSEERFGIASQLRRAAVSVATNIAEGRSRLTPGAYSAFLDNAGGSAGEGSYLLYLSHDLRYLDSPIYSPMASEIEEIRRMVGGLRRSVVARIRR